MAKNKDKKPKKEVNDFLSSFSFEIEIVFKHYAIQKEALSELATWLVLQETFNGFEVENGFDHFTLTIYSGNTYNLGLLNDKIQELFPEADWDD